MKTAKPRKILTYRMLEYLVLAGLGFRNNEIAEFLCVNITTVKKTLKYVYYKLKAFDRANAIMIAYTHKIITVELCEEILEKYPAAKRLLEERRQKKFY